MTTKKLVGTPAGFRMSEGARQLGLPDRPTEEVLRHMLGHPDKSLTILQIAAPLNRHATTVSQSLRWLEENDYVAKAGFNQRRNVQYRPTQNGLYAARLLVEAGGLPMRRTAPPGKRYQNGHPGRFGRGENPKTGATRDRSGGRDVLQELADIQAEIDEFEAAAAEGQPLAARPAEPVTRATPVHDEPVDAGTPPKWGFPLVSARANGSAPAYSQQAKSAVLAAHDSDPTTGDPMPANPVTVDDDDDDQPLSFALHREKIEPPAPVRDRLAMTFTPDERDEIERLSEFDSLKPKQLMRRALALYRLWLSLQSTNEELVIRNRETGETERFRLW